MQFSIRRRLIAVAALAALACAAALFAINHLVRTGRQQRIERATEVVTREVERLRDNADAPGPARRPHLPPNGQGGFLTPTLEPDRSRPPGPLLRDAVSETARGADESHPVVLREYEEPQSVVVIAVAHVPSGGFAWALMRVGTPRVLEGWRVGVYVLALATLGLVFATVQTLFAFQRGATTLRGALAALSQDLRAPVSRPAIRELGEVADGISGLAAKLSLARDNEALLQNELAAQERLASLGRVAAGLAHEVRNPLAAIKLRVDLAHRAPSLPEQLSRDLADVSAEISRLDRLVADLLTLAGRKTGARAETDLTELARERTQLLAPVASARGVQLEVRGTARGVVDRDALARALDNLLRNAVEASPANGVVTAALTDSAASARLEVTDQGSGVPPERVAELFEPFFTTKPEGTGLGLALSRAIGEAHGGTLGYQREGNVTTFVLTLPH